MIIGRIKEIDILNKAIHSTQAEFVALYGRRRVGKTYLIRKLFEQEPHYFELTGLKNSPLKKQLYNFTHSFSEQYLEGLTISPPKNWIEAFELLTKQLEKVPETKKIILFFDELPWLSSKKSGFMEALDYFWNKKWCRISNITLIVCGSAASWMLDNLISNKGGLHNRITKRILLEPFKLDEVEEFLKVRGFKLTRPHILKLYMVFGGIPYYLRELDKTLSVSQNINALCFNKNGLLTDEFSRLFQSLFEYSDHYIEIMRILAKHHYGMSRENLIKTLGIVSGGRIDKRMEELEATGFVKNFVPFGQKKGIHYRVSDEYSLFYLTWIEPYLKQGAVSDYWLKQLDTPRYYAWAGYAFESICFKHIDLISTALGIESLLIGTGSWRSKNSKKIEDQGAQVDCLFERKDGAVHLCEIKFKEKPYEITKEEAVNLKNKILTFMQEFPGREIFLSIISASGLKPTLWSEDLVSHVITGDALFTGPLYHSRPRVIDIG
jgi:AAA+ ATPase superfamily predicted ATPase